MKSDLRSLLVVGAGRLLQIIFSFASIKIATTLISPYELGRQNILLSIGGVLILIFLSPIASFWNRRLQTWKDNGHLLQVAIFYLLCTIGLLIPVSLLVFLINKAGGIGTPLFGAWLIWVIFSGFFVAAVCNTFVASFNFLGQRITYVTLNNFVLWGGLLLSVIFVKNYGASAEWWYSGPMVLRLMIVCLLLPVALYNVGKDPQKERLDIKQELAGLGTFSSPLFLYSFIYVFQNNSYPFLFGIRADAAALGLFVVGSGVGATPLTMFSTLFQEYYNPIFYKSINREPDQTANSWNLYLEVYMPAMVAFGVFSIGISPILVKLMLGPSFQSVGWLAVWGVIAQLLVIVYSMLNLASQAYFRTGLMILPTIFGAIITVTLLWLILPFNPLVGGVLAVVLGNLAIVLGLLWQIKKVMIIIYPWKQMAIAIILSSPILLILTKSGWLPDSFIKLLAIFFVVGIYALGVQLVLGRKWLFKR